MAVLAVPPPPTRSRLLLTWSLGLLAPAALAGVLIWHRRTVGAGLDTVSEARPAWMLASGVGVIMIWAAATARQLGALSAPVDVRHVFATQVAGSFINHVVPGGVGGTALTVRMLRRAGVSPEASAGAIMLNAAAGLVVHVLSIAAVVLLVRPSLHVGIALRTIVIGAAVSFAVLLAVPLLVGNRTRLRLLVASLRGGFAHLGPVLRHPGRALLLWGGSLALPALHIVILMTVLRGLGQSLPFGRVAVVYFVASAIAAAIPGPGGFGGLDVGLLAALAGAGMSAPHAAATVIGYRMVTVWLPLLPGALTLLVLVRRRVV